MKSYILVFLFLLILSSCSIHPMRQAKNYKYRFNDSEKKYNDSFTNQDSTFLLSNKKIEMFQLSSDSLIVFAGNKIYRFFKDSFQIELKKKKSVYVKTYKYDGNIISLKRFDNQVLIYEKRNINGILKKINVNLGVSY